MMTQSPCYVTRNDGGGHAQPRTGVLFMAGQTLVRFWPKPAFISVEALAVTPEVYGGEGGIRSIAANGVTHTTAILSSRYADSLKPPEPLKDRASPPPERSRGPDGDDPWKGIWFAGLCSSTQLRPRALFYMMLVGETCGNHAAAWESLRSPSAKSAHRDPFGDIYEPLKLPCQQPWRSSSYKAHLPGHAHDAKGRDYDIERSFHGRHPHLLVGDPRHSYLWSRPTIALQARVDVDWTSAHHRFYAHLSEFLLLCQ